jgi:hypothetical protein
LRLASCSVCSVTRKYAAAAGVMARATFPLIPKLRRKVALYVWAA